LIVDPCLAQECQGLLEAGVKPNSNCASRAIGYRQAIDFLMVSGLLGGVAGVSLVILWCWLGLVCE
jgi:hypothetical protein